MKINRNKLLQVMKKVLSITSNDKNIINGADCFVFNGKYIMSYNDELSIVLPFEIDIVEIISIKADIFFKLINKIKTKEIEFIVDNNYVKIKAGKTLIDLSIMENKIFEYIKSLNLEDIKFKDLSDDFFEKINCCSIKNDDFILDGLYIDGNILYATDRVSLHISSLDRGFGQAKLSSKAVCEIIKVDDLQSYCVVDEWIHFKNKDGLILSCRNNNGNYPIEALRKIRNSYLKSNFDCSINLPIDFFDAVDKAIVLSDRSENIFNMEIIKIKVSKDAFLIFSENSIGKLRERIDFNDNAIDIDQIIIFEIPVKVFGNYINKDMILSFCSKINGKYIDLKFSDNKLLDYYVKGVLINE